MPQSSENRRWKKMIWTALFDDRLNFIKTVKKT
jgi:hypothetical protein